MYLSGKELPSLASIALLKQGKKMVEVRHKVIDLHCVESLFPIAARQAQTILRQGLA
jgi:hypothetical protein